MDYIIDKKLLNEVIDCLKYTNYWVCGGNDTIINKLKHLKHIEWSEEDEKFLKTALLHIGYSVSNGKNTDIHCDITDWLKSLKERIKGE